MNEPVYFWVRHLSPAGAFHLRRLLDEVKPKLVLVEGPSDLTAQMEYITAPETVPPIAILAYTQAAPVRSILYPFAEYSPEYQAILWARKNGAECRFMDLPSDVFLALGQARPEADTGDKFDAWAALDARSGEDGHETFWERTLEHTTAPDAYRRGRRNLEKRSGPSPPGKAPTGRRRWSGRRTCSGPSRTRWRRASPPARSWRSPGRSTWRG